MSKWWPQGPKRTLLRPGLTPCRNQRVCCQHLQPSQEDLVDWGTNHLGRGKTWKNCNIQPNTVGQCQVFLGMAPFFSPNSCSCCLNVCSFWHFWIHKSCGLVRRHFKTFAIFKIALPNHHFRHCHFGRWLRVSCTRVTLKINRPFFARCRRKACRVLCLEKKWNRIKGRSFAGPWTNLSVQF